MRASVPRQAGAQTLAEPPLQRPPQPPRLVTYALRRDLSALTAQLLDPRQQQGQAGWQRGPGGAASAGSPSAALPSVHIAPAAPGGIWQRRRQRLVRAGAGAASRHLVAPPPPPSPAEQEQLLAAAASGDQHATARLVDANRSLVMFLARRYVKKGLDWEDLVAEGVMALERAAVRYRPDPDGTATFGTFAAAVVQNALVRALRQQSRDVRLPAHHYSDMAVVQQATKHVSTQLLRPPSCAEVAQQCGFTPSYTLHLLRSMSPGKSGALAAAREAALARDPRDQLLLGPDELGAVLLDDSPDSTIRLEEALAAQERWRVLEAELRRCLDRLDPQQAAAVELRHGLGERGGGRRRTWAQVGEALGRTGSWAATQCLNAERQLGAMLAGCQHAWAALSDHQLHASVGGSNGSSDDSSIRQAGVSRGVSGSMPSVQLQQQPLTELEACASRLAGTTQHGSVLSLREAVEDALGRLAPEEQVVLALRWGWLDGSDGAMPWKDVAARMKRSFNGAINVHRQAESILRARLGALGHAEVDLSRLRFGQSQRATWAAQLQALPPPATRRGSRGKRANRIKPAAATGRRQVQLQPAGAAGAATAAAPRHAARLLPSMPQPEAAARLQRLLQASALRPAAAATHEVAAAPVLAAG